MRFNFALKTMLFVAVTTSLVSCNKSKDYQDNSRATGWRLDGKDGSMKYQTDYQGQETGPGLVFVEGGTFTMGKVQDDVMHDWNNSPTQQHVQSFYMDETEVTNAMYLEYLDWLKKTCKDPNMAIRMSNHVLSQILYYQLKLTLFQKAQQSKKWLEEKKEIFLKYSNLK